MHVRALDDSEDTLLGYYLDAAISYLAQQTNRVLGNATATVVLCELSDQLGALGTSSWAAFASLV